VDVLLIQSLDHADLSADVGTSPEGNGA